MHFKKGQRIKHKKKLWECIVADDELAVFCPLKVKKDGWGTSYSKANKGLFYVNNTDPDGFKYSYIVK